MTDWYKYKDRTEVPEKRTGRKWTLQQRLEQSRKRRKSTALFEEDYFGRRHYELVWHLIRANVRERVLSYEAWMNGTTLEEWISRHRITGQPIGREIYLPPYFWVGHLDGDLHNTDPGNLHIFTSKKAHQSWARKKLRLPDNRREIYEKCIEFTYELKLKLQKFGHPQTWGKFLMTHRVVLTIGLNSVYQTDKAISVPCKLTGEQMSYHQIPHLEVELEDRQKFWVAADRVHEGVT